MSIHHIWPGLSSRVSVSSQLDIHHTRSPEPKGLIVVLAFAFGLESVASRSEAFIACDSADTCIAIILRSPPACRFYLHRDIIMLHHSLAPSLHSGGPLTRCWRVQRVHARSLVTSALAERESASDSLTCTSDVKEYIDQVCELGGPLASVDSSRLAGALGTSVTEGLPASKVAANRAAFGSNALPDQAQPTFLELMAEAVQDFTLLILLGSGFLSLALWAIVDSAQGPGWIDSVAILAAVAVVVLVTATTNYQRDKQFSKLSKEEGNITVRKQSDTQST